MKRKILGGLAVLIIAVAAAWNVNFGSKSNVASDIMLANVEALADPETPTPRKCSKIATYCNCKKNGQFCCISIISCYIYDCSSIMDQSSCSTTNCPSGTSC